MAYHLIQNTTANAYHERDKSLCIGFDMLQMTQRLVHCTFTGMKPRFCFSCVRVLALGFEYIQFTRFGIRWTRSLLGSS